MFTIVTRPFCLVESHIVKDGAKAGVLCFTSFTFCYNISCSLRLNKRIYICNHSSVSYLIELAVMINLHNYTQYHSITIYFLGGGGAHKVCSQGLYIPLS